jgi:hypothetical protein
MFDVLPMCAAFHSVNVTSTAAHCGRATDHIGRAFSLKQALTKRRCCAMKRAIGPGLTTTDHNFRKQPLMIAPGHCEKTKSGLGDSKPSFPAEMPGFLFVKQKRR